MVLKPSLPKLTEAHDFTGFCCGAEENDDWLHRRALKGQVLGNANVYVYEHKGRVLGFYAIATGGVEMASAPGSVRRNSPAPVPVLLLARLGVDRKAHGRGVGRLLLQDVLLRSLLVAEEVGFRALVIHCRDEAARDFYLKTVPSFARSPTDPLNLFLSLKALREFAEQLA